jgi:hypothetical protein
MAALYEQHDTEYPQLAVAFGAAVGAVADVLPPGSERLIAFRPNRAPDIGCARFQVALGLVLLGIDTGLFLLIARLARQPAWVADCPTSQTWRLGLYVAGTAVLGPLVYDRLDLVVGASALIALVALGSGLPAVAYAVLTAGVAFKLVPAVLLPVFVFAAAAQRGGRFWPAVLREAAVAAVILLLWPVLAYGFGGGDRAFVFLKYHAARGLELGSLYSAALLPWADTEIGYDFGGYVVRGPVPDAVARVAQVVVLAAVGLAVFVAGRAVYRVPAARRIPVVAAGCVLVWLAFIATNKVGSPQYLLWLAPLVPLMPLRTAGDRRWAVGFVIAGLLATLTYPYLWKLVHGAPLPDRTDAWAGPTPFGLALLFARWAVVVVLTGWLAVRLCCPAPAEPATGT